MKSKEKQKNIPNGWIHIKLGKVSTISAGGTPSTKRKDFWGGNVPWMNSGDLNKRVVFEVDGRITESGLKSSAAKILPINSVLIGLAGQGKTRGTVAINKIKLCTNQSVATFIPGKNLNYQFLFYNLDRRYEELRRISAGDGGRGGLNLQILKSLKIKLPAISEQNNIVGVLGVWDAIIDKLLKKIEIKKRIKKGLIRELLTGKTRLPGFRREWEIKSFTDCFDVKNKIRGEKKFDYLVYGRFPVIDQGQSKISGYSNNKDLVINDNLPFIVFGDHTRILKLIDFPFILGNDGTKVFFGKADYDTNFLFYLLNTIEIPNTGYNRHFKFLKDAIIKIPNSKKEQVAIAKILTTADDEIMGLEKKMGILKDQKKFLLNNLITGVIRVPEGVYKCEFVED
jgi:type I restriction enzyme S subunit